jgi:hypothetical protein
MTIWWIGVLTYTVFHGFAFGVKNAFYMDIVTPKVAATQFTGLMALTNLTNGWSYLWQSQVWGDKGLNWPIWNMLYLDCALGLVFLVVLFFIRPESEKKKAAGPMEI